MYVEGWNVHRVVRPSRLANAVIERLLLRILAALPTESTTGDLLSYREAAHQFGKVLAEASGNEVARCVVETIDVPVPEGPVDEEFAAMVKTQEFAERLYARIVRSTESGN